MIAGEDKVAVDKRKSEMVAGMSRRGDSLHLPAVAGNQRPVRQPDIRRVILIDPAIDRRLVRQPPPAASRAVAQRPGRGSQALDAAAMVAVSMGDQYVGDRLAGRDGHQRVEMGRVIRAGIDDGHPAVADDVAVGAGEGEGAGVWCRDPAQAGRHSHRLPVSGVEIAMEDEIGHRHSRGHDGRRGEPAHDTPLAGRPARGRRVVGVAGFEPATPCSRSRCATRLRYTPVPGGADL